MTGRAGGAFENPLGSIAKIGAARTCAWIWLS